MLALIVYTLGVFVSAISANAMWGLWAGGLVIGIAIILFALAFDLEEAMHETSGDIASAIRTFRVQGEQWHEEWLRRNSG